MTYLLLSLLLTGIPGRCVHYEGDGCKAPMQEPWRSHCPPSRIGPPDMGTPHPPRTDERFTRLKRSSVKKAGDVNTYVVTIRLDDGSEMRAVARSDKVCPMSNCNGTLRIKVSGTYPNDDIYPARISERSSGQLGIDLVWSPEYE